MTLKISQAHIDAILEQSRVEYPDEACGVILGPLGKDHALRLKPMINAAHSPTFYEFDPKDLLSLYREVDDNDEEIVVIYHSHTETEAYPSRTDIAYAGELIMCWSPHAKRLHLQRSFAHIALLMA
jgi:proteasome lid subunit RPN8/RPN11